MPSKLRKSSIDEAICFSCHDSYESLAAKTTEVTVLTDSAGTTVNPHALPASDDHDRLTCIDCHSMHGAEGADALAQNACVTCHHTGVYECGTCH